MGVSEGVFLEGGQHRHERVDLLLVDALYQAVCRDGGKGQHRADKLVGLVGGAHHMRAAVGLVLVAHHEALALKRVQVPRDGCLLLVGDGGQLFLRQLASLVQLVDEVPLARGDVVGLERDLERFRDVLLRIVHQVAYEAVVLALHVEPF